MDPAGGAGQTLGVADPSGAVLARQRALAGSNGRLVTRTGGSKPVVAGSATSTTTSIDPRR
jgi:hypothetical protein